MAGTTSTPFGGGTGTFGLLQRDELLDSLKELYKTSKYGDLIVLCGGESFIVHKAIVFPRAKLFAQHVCEGGKTTTIKLQEDPEMAKRMFEYLYTLDYDDRPKNSAPSLPAPSEAPATTAAASLPPTFTLSAPPPAAPTVTRAASSAPDTSSSKRFYAQVASASNTLGLDPTTPSVFAGLRAASVTPAITQYPNPAWTFGSTTAPLFGQGTISSTPVFGSTVSSTPVFGQRATSAAPTTSTQSNAAPAGFGSTSGPFTNNKPAAPAYAIPAKRGSTSTASELPPAKRPQTSNTAAALVQTQTNGTAGTVVQRQTSITWTASADNPVQLTSSAVTQPQTSTTATGADADTLAQMQTMTQNLIPDIFKKDPASMSINAHMYALGYKYGINGLKVLAKDKFSFGAKDRFHHREFPKAVEVVFTSTPDSDIGLRDVVVGIIAEHITLLQNPEIEKMMMKFSGLSFAVLKKKFP